MEACCCDLQVDVNGEETFLVDKRLISEFSGRLRKLFGKSTGSARNLKVIFHDFPGGAEGFELITRFCYNRGVVDITTSNIPILHCAAHFMEMKNLMELTEKSLKEMSYWTWSELLAALKQCQDSLIEPTACGIVEKCLDSLVGRLALAANEASPCLSTSSTDSSGFRFSCDTRSTESLRSNNFFRASWWFEDLLFLNPTSVRILTKSMILHKFDQIVVSRFLFYYQKCKSCAATPEDKCIIIETVIGMLYLLDSGSVSCKSLFGTLQAAMSLKISKCCIKKLESMISSQMDQATLDNLLVPSPCGKICLYDVSLVLRFVKAFLRGPNYLKQIRKVGGLMDLYIAEVAPDQCLKPSKFSALVKALPDCSRDSHDELYRAMDMYLKVHKELSEEQKIEICCALNYEKLSAETCKHISQNPKFPSKSSVQAHLSKQNKLAGIEKSKQNQRTSSKDEGNDQIVVYGEKLDDSEKLKAHLQGMQWRVMELESVCRKMQTEMAKVMKSRVSNQKSSRSLPKLCS